MRNHLRSLIVFIGILVSLGPSLLQAQATGEITGTVVDPSGAVVPNVRVTATHTATGVSRFTITGGAPQFFSNAFIGSNNGIGDGFFALPTVTSPVNGQAVLPTPGNLGRNTFTVPGWSNLDFSIIKDTKITESKTLQFRAEFFNILNQATFGTPGGIIGSSSFGISTGTATTERQIQFGLKFIF